MVIRQKTKGTVNYREKDAEVKKFLDMLSGTGGMDQLVKFRNLKYQMRKHQDAIFNADLNIDSNTTRTDLLESHLCRTAYEIVKKQLRIPDTTIAPYDDGPRALDAKEMASIVNGAIEVFLRMTRFDSMYQVKGKEEQIAFGDLYIMPIIDKVVDKMIPQLEFCDSENLIIDPNSSFLISGSSSDQAQYWARTKLYPERNLVERFGSWILDHVESGYMLDDRRFKKVYDDDSVKYYEVVEGQCKSNGSQFILVGGNAFPVMRIVEGVQAPSGLKKLRDQGVVSWTDTYLYKDEIGRNILTLANLMCYFNSTDARNWGVVNKLGVPQTVHKIIENLKVDNLIQKLDQVKVVVGGNADKIEKSRREYRTKKRSDRTAVWYMPASQSRVGAEPKPTVFKFDGITYQEGESGTQGLLDFSKNATGFSIQRQEIKTNVAVSQTDALDEEKSEFIEDISGDNIENVEMMYRMFLRFCIAHKGFGLNEVMIPYTKYTDPEVEEGFPEGIKASMSFPEAMKRIEKFSYSVSINKNSFTTRSRGRDSRSLQDLLQFANPQVFPEWYKALVMKIAENLSVELPDIDNERVKQAEATGGRSQFQSLKSGQGSPNPQQNEVL